MSYNPYAGDTPEYYFSKDKDFSILFGGHAIYHFKAGQQRAIRRIVDYYAGESDWTGECTCITESRSMWDCNRPSQYWIDEDDPEESEFEGRFAKLAVSCDKITDDDPTFTMKFEAGTLTYSIADYEPQEFDGREYVFSEKVKPFVIEYIEDLCVGKSVPETGSFRFQMRDCTQQDIVRYELDGKTYRIWKPWFICLIQNLDGLVRKA